MAGKYADRLPLYRQQTMFKRLGHELDRSTTAHWSVRLESVPKPLIKQIRESQIQGGYPQVDETRIQVLKESGKRAQSDKWMWVIRGGPPGQPSVLLTSPTLPIQLASVLCVPSQKGLLPDCLQPQKKIFLLSSAL